jgi:hypothetical protein
MGCEGGVSASRPWVSYIQHCQIRGFEGTPWRGSKKTSVKSEAQSVSER